MLLTNYNQQAAIDTALDKIRRSTGIDNYTSSSKIKTIIESLNLDVLLFADQIAESINTLHEETATGESLDLLGSKLKVYRNSDLSIDISVEDQALEIVPSQDSNPFSTLISDPIYIYAGEFVDVSDGVILVFSDDIEITSGSSDLFFSAQIISDGTSSVSLSEEDIIKLDETLIGLGSLEPFISIRVAKNIAIDAQDSSDEAYRERIIYKKNSLSDIGITSAIRSSLLDIPGDVEFAIYNNSGGSGNIEIYLITEKQKISEVDNNYNIVLGLARNKLREVIAHGIDYSVSSPLEMEAVITYEYTSDIDIDPDTIKAAIYKGFYLNYIYDEENMVDMSEIELYVKESVSSISTFNIYDVAVYNSEISEFVSFGHNKVYLPQGAYATLLKENISELV